MAEGKSISSGNGSASTLADVLDALAGRRAGHSVLAGVPTDQNGSQAGQPQQRRRKTQETLRRTGEDRKEGAAMSVQVLRFALPGLAQESNS